MSKRERKYLEFILTNGVLQLLLRGMKQLQCGTEMYLHLITVVNEAVL